MKSIVLSLFFCCAAATGYCQWNSNTAVNLEAAGINAGPISTATTSDGKTFIAFYSQTSSGFDMRVQLLDKDGNKLFAPNGIVANSYPTGSATYVFNTCIGPENSLIIACQDQRNSSNGAVLIMVNQNGTLPWGNGGVYLGAGLAPYPVLLASGEILVAWNDNTNKISYQKVGAGGSFAWSTPKQVQLTVGTTAYNTTAAVPVANPTGSGFTLIMQRRGTGISGTLYAQRYNAAGDPVWTNYVQLANGTVSTTRTYSVTAAADTIYYGYYSSVGSRFNSFVQRINPDGTLPWGINGAPFSTYSGTQPYNQTTNIAHTPGSPYIWSVCSYSNSNQSQFGVYVQKFDAATGARLFNVDGKEIYPISATQDRQEGTLALVNDAPLFMTYDANYKLYATLLDGSGNFVWPSSRVELSSTTASISSPKGRFNFTPAINGQAVAVWNENRGTEARAYAQNIAAAGATGPLPVRLSGFAAIKKGPQVELQWSTASESNNGGFYIQRSTNGVHFTNLLFVPSKASGGNSQTTIRYNTTDLTPLPNDNYYRLQQIDRDGKTFNSQVLLVKFADKGLYVQSLYPNPADKELQLALHTPAAGNATLRICDLNGRTHIRQAVTLQSGTTSIRLRVGHLPAGQYLLQLTTADQEVITEKWLKK